MHMYICYIRLCTYIIFYNCFKSVIIVTPKRKKKRERKRVMMKKTTRERKTVLKRMMTMSSHEGREHVAA